MASILQQSNTTQEDKVFHKILITRKVSVNIINVGGNIKQTLEKILSSQISGKCVVEGYIKKNTINIVTYSSGSIDGENVQFDVIFECDVCMPVEGMQIDCTIKNITKAGIRAEVGVNNSPLIIFIARDHHDITDYFNSVNIGDNIQIRVIGQRFELNDTFISIIAELLEPRQKIVIKKRNLVVKT